MNNNKQKFKLVMFDMDGTLLDGRTIFVISEKKGFKNKLFKVLESNKEAYQKSIEIAASLIKELKGMGQGVHIMPLGWDKYVPEILEKGELI